MPEGEIHMDDLVTIIGEQTVVNRLLQQEKREITKQLESMTIERNTLQRTLEMERGGSGDRV